MKIRRPRQRVIRSHRPSAQAAALEKVHTHLTEDGTPAQSLRTLIAELATRVRNTCRTPGDLEHPATFDLLTTPTDLQRRAFELVDQITV